jgi:hypothetical protein
MHSHRYIVLNDESSLLYQTGKAVCQKGLDLHAQGDLVSGRRTALQSVIRYSVPLSKFSQIKLMLSGFTPIHVRRFDCWPDVSS